MSFKLTKFLRFLFPFLLLLPSATWRHSEGIYWHIWTMVIWNKSEFTLFTGILRLFRFWYFWVRGDIWSCATIWILISKLHSGLIWISSIALNMNSRVYLLLLSHLKLFTCFLGCRFYIHRRCRVCFKIKRRDSKIIWTKRVYDKAEFSCKRVSWDFKFIHFLFPFLTWVRYESSTQ